MSNEEEIPLPESLDDYIPLDIEILSITIKLSRTQGQFIKDLIQENYPHTFPRYCERVQVKTPNFYSMLNGERPCTLEQLNKLLSGIRYEACINDAKITVRSNDAPKIVTDPDDIIAQHDNGLEDEYD